MQKIKTFGFYLQSTLEEDHKKYTKRDVFHVVNDIFGPETQQKLETHQYKIDCETTNQISKVWRFFKPIVHPSDLLFIQPRVLKKLQWRDRKSYVV